MKENVSGCFFLNTVYFMTLALSGLTNSSQYDKSLRTI